MSTSHERRDAAHSLRVVCPPPAHPAPAVGDHTFRHSSNASGRATKLKCAGSLCVSHQCQMPYMKFLTVLRGRNVCPSEPDDALEAGAAEEVFLVVESSRGPSQVPQKEDVRVRRSRHLLAEMISCPYSAGGGGGKGKRDARKTPRRCETGPKRAVLRQVPRSISRPAVPLPVLCSAYIPPRPPTMLSCPLFSSRRGVRALHNHQASFGAERWASSTSFTRLVKPKYVLLSCAPRPITHPDSRNISRSVP